MRGDRCGQRWPGGEDTTTGFFDGIDRWRTANPPPGPRVRAAARLQLGNFRRPHQERWWEALTLITLLAAAVVAAPATAAFEDAPALMVLLVVIALLLAGVSVYAVYALQLAYTIPETTNRWDLLFDPHDEQCAATLTAARAELTT
ncbi:hypothetical protein [Rhodococcus sp. IEGM 1307]|uniref:hypothetical protein n=1 Tax=Rhodococcus sp. IEGM 1307 TaxID=3047091 RepID=UPI0024B66E76|nr:hypothetical protein [Rhodococcus sp. IEGM 1307]MDI9979336.1 hypothetical protein [Rhodococcus sp. IEGM 1307]